MRMRAHVDALVRQKFRRSHLVEEDERPDHLTFDRRQCAAHLHLAQIHGARHDQGFDGIDGVAVPQNGIGAGRITHFDVPFGSVG